MKRLFWLLSAFALLVILRSVGTPAAMSYDALYTEHINTLIEATTNLRGVIVGGHNINTPAVTQAINDARVEMKRADFWLRYLEPGGYRLINAPLPVEWETEVFEKFEKPYRREGGGLTLAALQLDEHTPDKQRLLALVDSIHTGCNIFRSDSVRSRLHSYHHFYLCNRLFLLNLASIYTTGFECPAPDRLMPELKEMLLAVAGIYQSFNSTFPQTPLPGEYIEAYKKMVGFVNTQPDDATIFDHYSFIRDYVNPLFTANQELISRYHVTSRSMIDYSLSRRATSIFDKRLYTGQNAKGIFRRVDDSAALASIEATGRMLFYDPILSGNNQRSCASCHKPDQYFTDTAVRTALHFNQEQRLPRNTPTLLNAGFNHLLMADGRHFTAEDQAKDVISNPSEMGCAADEVVRKVMSCSKYKTAFKKLMKYTPQEPALTMGHIASCITWYYNSFSNSYSPFDNAMNRQTDLSAAARRGFNLFMNKAQCATCHFIPQFNGVKPPYIGSEFEVLGVPADITFTSLSADSGRYSVNAATETLRAFRTVTIRNAARTAPYMHNGAFRTLREVIDFYDAGGGAGHGLNPGNQTLSADSLHLSETEKEDIIAFINALNEDIDQPIVPSSLPASRLRALKTRKPGGIY